MKRLLNLLAILAVIVVQIVAFVPYPVHATTTTLTVTGDSAGGFNSYGAGGWAGMNTIDGNTTYAVGNNSNELWTFTNPGLPAGATINSVTLTVISFSGTPGDVFYARYYDGATVFSSTSIGNYRATYGTDTYTWTTNPGTGMAWTETQVNNGDFGIASATGRYTYINIVVDYTAPLVPTVTTQAVTAITPTTATGHGNVTSDGGSAITERGTVYSVAANPTTANTKDIATGTTGAYTTSIDTLTKGTLYHVRAYAINAIGTSYGADVSFTTINDPTISTVAASLVSATTARLNSNVTFDGSAVTGEPCTVKIAYVISTSPHATYANCAAGVEVTLPGTYITGQLPYTNVTGLTTSSTYYFCTKITNSTGVAGYGSILSFVTESGVYAPTNLTAIPTSTSISAAWTKGIGAQYTLVRYSDATYPLVNTDGLLAYLDTGNSKQITGLVPGTTYYITAWGKTGAVYSASTITVMATTLAYDNAASSNATLTTPTPDSTWTQIPTSSKTATIPVYGGLMQGVADAYHQPINYVWYLAWMLAAVGVGIGVYIWGHFNIVLAVGAFLEVIGIGVWWYNIVAGGVLMLLGIIAIGWILTGLRRPGG
jgi:hypothetical protein